MTSFVEWVDYRVFMKYDADTFLKIPVFFINVHFLNLNHSIYIPFTSITNKGGIIISQELSNVLGNPKTREEVLHEIWDNEKVYPAFRELNKIFQEEYIEFCMGVRGVKMTYDAFFKAIFDPEKHPERLSEMLSCVLGRKLKVKRALPLERSRMHEKGTLVIVDIIVEFESGELADVEIQKVGYMFPGQRASCYSADMIMRQYEREKSIRGDKFTYKDLKKVYTIVFIENCSTEFRKYPEVYVHRGKVEFDSKIEMELLQEFLFLPLDIFFAFKDNNREETINNELEAWLYFLGSDKPEHILKLTNAYPKFVELYQDICKFRYLPEEAIGMFSDALRQLDENTAKYMIEEYQRELENKINEICTVNEELGRKKKQLEDQTKQLEEKEKSLMKKEKEIAELKRLLAEKGL